VRPEALNKRYDFKAASGTQIKFTRSFPANAIAREKVPIRTMSLNTFTLNERRSWSIIDQTTREAQRKSKRFACTQLIMFL
jgi:hypothetical protein